MQNSARIIFAISVGGLLSASCDIGTLPEMPSDNHAIGHVGDRIGTTIGNSTANPVTDSAPAAREQRWFAKTLSRVNEHGGPPIPNVSTGLEPEVLDFAKHMATLATIAYSPDELETLLANPAFATQGKWEIHWKPTDSQPHFAFIASRFFGFDVEYAIVFRGTDSVAEMLEDTQARTRVNPCGITEYQGQKVGIAFGFNEAYKQILQLKDSAGVSFSQAVGNLPHFPPVSITGHSLGGALATVLALCESHADAGREFAVFTFAAPTAGNQGFVDMYDRFIFNTLRFYTELDPVPRFYNSETVESLLHSYNIDPGFPGPKIDPLSRTAVETLAARIDQDPQQFGPYVHPFGGIGLGSRFSGKHTAIWANESLQQHLTPSYLCPFGAPLVPDPQAPCPMNVFSARSKAPQIKDFGYRDNWRVGRNPRFVVDVDNDGRSDVVGFADDGVWVSYSEGNGFSKPVQEFINKFGLKDGWDYRTKHLVTMADVNGDQRADIVGFKDEGVIVSLAQKTGRGFQAPELWGKYFAYDQLWRLNKHPRLVLDIDGDQKADIVGFGDAGVWVATSTGAFFDDPRLWVKQFGYNSEAGAWRIAKHPRFVADVDGDGYKDVIGFGNSGVYVSFANDGSFTPPHLLINDYGYDQGWRVENHPRFVVDVNSDDKADIIANGNIGVVVALSTGRVFRPAQQWSKWYGYQQGWDVVGAEGVPSAVNLPRFVKDINNDNLPDYIGFYTDGVYASINTGIALDTGDTLTVPTRWVTDYGAQTNPPWLPSRHLRIIGDVTGDKRSDIVGFFQDGVYTSY